MEVAKARASLNKAVRKYSQLLPYGDAVVMVNIPGSRQGHVTVVHSLMPPEIPLAVLKAINSTMPGTDPRLEKKIKYYEKRVTLVEGETSQPGIHSLLNIRPV